jgi:hypothetical protein
VNCARCETRPMIRTEALQPAAHVITAKHTCPARHIALAYPGFPSICYSNPKSGQAGRSGNPRRSVCQEEFKMGTGNRTVCSRRRQLPDHCRHPATWRVTMASWRNSGEQATLCSNCNAAYPPLQVILHSRCVWLSMRRKFFRP